MTDLDASPPVTGDEPGPAPEPIQPVPVLAGHLVIYADAIAFRPDGGADDEVIVRPVLSMARDHLWELLTPGDGGLLGAVMSGGNPLAMLKKAGLGPKQIMGMMNGGK